MSRLYEESETPSAEPSQPQSLTSLSGGLRLLNTTPPKSRQFVKRAHLRLHSLTQLRDVSRSLTLSVQQSRHITRPSDNQSRASLVEAPPCGLQRVFMRRHSNVTGRTICDHLLNDYRAALSSGLDNRRRSRSTNHRFRRALRSLTVTRRLRRGTLRRPTFRARRLTMTAVTLRRRRSPAGSQAAAFLLSHRTPSQREILGFRARGGMSL